MKTVVKNITAARRLLKERGLRELKEVTTSMQCDCGETIAIYGIDESHEIQAIIGLCKNCHANGWEDDSTPLIN